MGLTNDISIILGAFRTRNSRTSRKDADLAWMFPADERTRQRLREEAAEYEADADLAIAAGDWVKAHSLEVQAAVARSQGEDLDFSQGRSDGRDAAEDYERNEGTVHATDLALTGTKIVPPAGIRDTTAYKHGFTAGWTRYFAKSAAIAERHAAEAWERDFNWGQEVGRQEAQTRTRDGEKTTASSAWRWLNIPAGAREPAAYESGFTKGWTDHFTEPATPDR